MPPFPFLGHLPRIAVAAITLLGAGGMLAWRVRETRTPVTTRKIVLPPLGMATGFLMFVAPATRVPWSWGLAAFAVGALVFAIPLSRTSRLSRVGDAVVMRRSRAFLWILLGLFAVRLALRTWVEQHVTPAQTGALFFVLAFGMIVRWRAGMLVDFRRLRAEGAASGPGAAAEAAP
ncbi:CcdC family protein [Anaeromyxobacter oryzae]|uniref:Membrane protein n=1 Tax=Anaeromyxobacter oryzae TaxID=2918170 RepID=A0ABM7WX26_9BACT|nr:cytochrome c biogenesis protein CcdC [Anaeromyxobacter oryzae]BDG04052.1 membrane protein [Anaeromyxobacter oryzae]